MYSLCLLFVQFIAVVLQNSLSHLKNKYKRGMADFIGLHTFKKNILILHNRMQHLMCVFFFKKAKMDVLQFNSS